MIAPFLDQDLLWDFRLPRVASINTSGHKYGLVYPGVGWVLWRDSDALPAGADLQRELPRRQHAHLRAELLPPGLEVVAQYYTFFRLGRSGFRAVQQAARDVATMLSGQIAAMPEFRLLSRGDELPVFAFTTTERVTGWDVFALSRALRERGWQVPAYTFPEDRQDLSVLRIVCRNGFSHDLADLLLADLRAAVDHLNHDSRGGNATGPSGFRH